MPLSWQVFLLIGIFAFLLPTRVFLLKQVGLTQGGNIHATTEEVTGLLNETINNTILNHDVLAANTISADGSLVDFTIEDDSLRENLFIVIDNDNLMSINSPYAKYLPSLNRHGTITYIVENGDTASKIAAKFGVSVNTILWANNLSNGSVLKPGQELIILPVTGVRHIVQSGDNLNSIAKKYKASLNEIMAFNNLKNETDIKIGQELIIPNGQLPTVISLAKDNGLRPMTEDVSHLPILKNFFSLPVKGGWNTGILHYYNAVDIINSCGSPIYAANSGIVVDAKKGWNGGYGNYVKIQHFNGTLTLYAHLGEIYVNEGERVAQDQIIGTMSDTGHATGCHLHFEVRGAQNPFVLKK